MYLNSNVYTYIRNTTTASPWDESNKMNIPKSLVQSHVYIKHPASMSENRVDLNTVIIIWDDAVHRGEKVGRMTALPSS